LAQQLNGLKKQGRLLFCEHLRDLNLRTSARKRSFLQILLIFSDIRARQLRPDDFDHMTAEKSAES